MPSAEQFLDSTQFFALYQDPRWKQFSAKVRALYANVCSACRASNKTTQVHHWKYYKGRKPWEYDFGEVTLLCTSCHDRYHENLQNFRKFVFPRLPPAALQTINGALVVALSHSDPLFIAYAIAELCATPGAIQRFAMAWKPSPSPEPAKTPQNQS